MINIHYVYVYLDPRKPGKYEYFENGIGISFDHEPFYIGEGKKKRMYEHLKQAKDLRNKTYKYNKIRKIWSSDLEPLIYKISENMMKQDALNLERSLGFLIGRYNLNLGPLTNEVDCGGKATNPTQEMNIKRTKKIQKTLSENPEIQIKANKKISETKRNKSKEEKEAIYTLFKKTLEENPGIKVNAEIKRQQTLAENPEIEINRIKKFKETMHNDPSIKINQKKKEMETKKNNPEKIKEAGRKQSRTKRENPEIVTNAKIKEKETKKNNPDIMKNAVAKGVQTKKENPEILINQGKKISEQRLNETDEQKQKRLLNFQKTLKDNPEIMIDGTKKSQATRKFIKQIKLRCIDLIKEYDLPIDIKSLPIQGKKIYWENLEKNILCLIDTAQELDMHSDMAETGAPVMEKKMRR